MIKRRKSGRHPVQQLTVAEIRKIDKPGRYFDGHGLYLRVSKTGAKSWIQRLRIHNRDRELGHGSYPLVQLSEARNKALDCLRVARAGGDPLAARQQTKAIPTLAQAVESVIKVRKPGWRNPKSAKQWRSSFKTYAFQQFGERKVDSVTSADILSILSPIWHTKAETAQRLRGRLRAVFNWSVTHGFRSDNPAGDTLDGVLPKQTTTRRHFRALPYNRVSQAIAIVRNSDAAHHTKLCFEFLCLTAARSGEARLSTWSEINLDERLWTIPAERMKAGRGHYVPLSSRAVDILQEARRLSEGSDLVFPSPRGKALSDSTISKLLRELRIDGTPHGMRSAFRDWCAESGVSREIAELSLAHANPNKAEAAYMRTNLLDQRREIDGSMGCLPFYGEGSSLLKACRYGRH